MEEAKTEMTVYGSWNINKNLIPKFSKNYAEIQIDPFFEILSANLHFVKICLLKPY